MTTTDKGRANPFAAAADLDGGAKAARAVEWQRRYVILCRKYGIGNHPLTKQPPTHVPALDMTGGFSDRHPDFTREVEALCAEFADAMDSFQISRNVEFTEDQLAR